MLRQLEEARVPVVRPDPRTTQVGRLATVLIYGRDTVWGQWSPLRGALFPGTAIFCCRRPGSAVA